MIAVLVLMLTGCGCVVTAIDGDPVCAIFFCLFVGILGKAVRT